MRAELKSLNDRGIEAFRNYMLALKEDRTLQVPYELLADKKMTTTIRGFAEFNSDHSLGTRKDAGAYLVEKMSDVDVNEYMNVGIWSWLSLLYFKQLCPVFAFESKSIGEEACYIPSSDFRKYYRHKLLGPFNLYRIHKEYASALLTNQVHTVGDINETIASRQEFVQNPEMMKVVHRLYFDEEHKTFKRGTTTKKRRGSAHRLWAVKEQLDLTYDFFSMNSDEILSILPDEFDSWWMNAE